MRYSSMLIIVLLGVVFCTKKEEDFVPDFIPNPEITENTYSRYDYNSLQEAITADWLKDNRMKIEESLRNGKKIMAYKTLYNSKKPYFFTWYLPYQLSLEEKIMIQKINPSFKQECFEGYSWNTNVNSSSNIWTTLDIGQFKPEKTIYFGRGGMYEYHCQVSDENKKIDTNYIDGSGGYLAISLYKEEINSLKKERLNDEDMKNSFQYFWKNHFIKRMLPLYNKKNHSYEESENQEFLSSLNHLYQVVIQNNKPLVKPLKEVYVSESSFCEGINKQNTLDKISGSYKKAEIENIIFINYNDCYSIIVSSSSYNHILEYSIALSSNKMIQNLSLKRMSFPLEEL